MQNTGSIYTWRSWVRYQEIGTSCRKVSADNRLATGSCFELHEPILGIPGVIPKGDPEPFPFCGLANERPRVDFNPFRDVLLGDFILCHPNHKHHLLVWLGRALTCVDLHESPNYGTFTMEWRTPMKGSKKEGKRAAARECWTRRWSPELTLPQKISYTCVLYSHHMPSHKAKGPLKTHLILEASLTMAMANLATHGVGIDDDDEVEE